MLKTFYTLGYKNAGYEENHPGAWGYSTYREHSKAVEGFQRIKNRGENDKEFDNAFLAEHILAVTPDENNVSSSYVFMTYERQVKPVVVYNKQEKKAVPFVKSWTENDEAQASNWLHREANPYSQLANPGKYMAWKWLKAQQQEQAVNPQIAFPQL